MREEVQYGKVRPNLVGVFSLRAMTSVVVVRLVMAVRLLEQQYFLGTLLTDKREHC